MVQFHMDQELRLEALARPELRVSPRLVTASYILELSSVELQELITQEISQNPALELVEVAHCPTCGSELHGSICPRCIQRQKVEEPPGEVDWWDGTAGGSRREDPPRGEEFDPLTRLAAEETLAERLLRELSALVAPADLPIAEFLTGSLDERGYLTVSVEEAAQELDVEVERVRQVLKLLHTLEPAGVGARSLRECLLIQLDHLAALGLEHPHAREVVAHFLPELGTRRFARIAQATGLSVEAVADSYEFVRRKLNPHPAQGFSPTNARDRDTRALYIQPDVLISRSAEGFEVEVVESRRYALRVNALYMRLNSMAGRGRADSGRMSRVDRQHVRQYVNRARLFIAALNQRRQTLLTITRCIVERQRDFLEHGVRALRPLSRAAVAQAVGVHESTVSRATAGKYAMIPSGEVIPFSSFFTPSLSVKDVIKEIIDRERAPLSDSQIRDRLRSAGIDIARRTVAKYRKQLDILPAPLR